MENNEQTIPDFELPVIDQSLAMAGHVWIQHGNQLTCTSCIYEHGLILPTRHKIEHQDGGLPLIKVVD